MEINCCRVEQIGSMTVATYKVRLIDSFTRDVDQGIVHGWQVSWNPDDDRFYVERADGTAAATFKAFRNAVQYCRTHKPV